MVRSGTGKRECQATNVRWQEQVAVIVIGLGDFSERPQSKIWGTVERRLGGYECDGAAHS